MPVAFIDTLAAHQLKEGILMALLHRERSGQGAVVTCSLMESALASLVNQASNYLNAGVVPQRMGTAHPNIAPYGDIFACADGQSILLAVGTERQFRRLCQVLQLENLLEDPAYQTNAARVVHGPPSTPCWHGPLNAKPSKPSFRFPEFKQEGVPAARIRDMRAVFELPEAQAMVLAETTQEGIETKRVRTVAFRM